MSNWKRTSEELPEDGEAIIFRTDLSIYLGNYDELDDIFIDDTDTPILRVTSWCPIPEYDLKD